MDTNKYIKGYKIIKRIGRGGFGAVYLVQKENKNYALKKITDLTEDEIKDYQKILNILFNMKSEYIIRYYESIKENDCLYIIMEYGGDIDLKKYIIKQENSFINEKKIKDIIIQICKGLKEIHKNKLIHRDLTPDNIFMDNNNNIKIGDFGVSKVLTTTHNYTKSKAGKFKYLAPEIIKDEKYSYKVDIYSLGCVIYELFTLNEYYDAKNEDKLINTDIYNPKWQNVIDLTLKDNFKERPDIDYIYNYIQNEIDINDDKNEIICVYNIKDKKEIRILHDFKNDFYRENYEESYNEAKNNINKENIEIYVNDKKLKFNHYYKSNKPGLITIKFKLNKLLTSTAYMFSDCESLNSIDLSSLNINNIKDMKYMFNNCKSLKPIDLSSLNINSSTDIRYMFNNCSSSQLKDSSSYNDNNINDMKYNFNNFESSKSKDLSSFNSDDDEEPYTCKVVLIGESGVGKTSIISRYIKNTFNSQLLSSPGSNFVTKTVLMKDDNKSIKFEIWDTAGQERYRALAKVFYKNAAVCILVYDITRKASFNELKNYWYKEIKENTQQNISKIKIINIYFYYSLCFGWK